ncbi:MAG: hypothetical protein LT106_16570 [Burkholderiaceae bacterium]|nr:hypothetical protein [Burkholderiaceae bacterium]
MEVGVALDSSTAASFERGVQKHAPCERMFDVTSGVRRPELRHANRKRYFCGVILAEEGAGLPHLDEKGVFQLLAFAKLVVPAHHLVE